MTDTNQVRGSSSLVLLQSHTSHITTAEKTRGAEECLFFLTITPAARRSFQQFQVHSGRQTPERWEMILHSGWSLAAPFLSRSEPLGRDILSETREGHSVTHLNGEFSYMKPATLSMSMRERSMKYWCASKSDVRMNQMNRRGKCSVFDAQLS